MTCQLLTGEHWSVCDGSEEAGWPSVPVRRVLSARVAGGEGHGMGMVHLDWMLGHCPEMLTDWGL